MGKKIIGSKAVTAKGTTSVNHQKAIQIVTAAIFVTIGLPGIRLNPKNISAAQAGPSTNFIFFEYFINLFCSEIIFSFTCSRLSKLKHIVFIIEYIIRKEWVS